MTDYNLRLPFTTYATEISHVAQRALSDLHDEYPMYGPVYFGEVEKIVSEISKSKPLQIEEEAHALLAKLGEMTMALSEVRKRLEGK